MPTSLRKDPTRPVHRIPTVLRTNVHVADLRLRITNRGGKGVKTMSVTAKTGDLAAIKYVQAENDLMITTKQGVIIRVSVTDFRVMGRATQGVKVIKIDGGDAIADITVLNKAEEEDELVDEAEIEAGTEQEGDATPKVDQPTDEEAEEATNEKEDDIDGE